MFTFWIVLTALLFFDGTSSLNPQMFRQVESPTTNIVPLYEESFEQQLDVIIIWNNVKYIYSNVLLSSATTFGDVLTALRKDSRETVSSCFELQFLEQSHIITNLSAKVHEFHIGGFRLLTTLNEENWCERREKELTPVERKHLSVHIYGNDIPVVEKHVLVESWMREQHLINRIKKDVDIMDCLYLHNTKTNKPLASFNIFEYFRDKRISEKILLKNSMYAFWLTSARNVDARVFIKGLNFNPSPYICSAGQHLLPIRIWNNNAIIGEQLIEVNTKKREKIMRMVREQFGNFANVNANSEDEIYENNLVEVNITAFRPAITTVFFETLNRDGSTSDFVYVNLSRVDTLRDLVKTVNAKTNWNIPECILIKNVERPAFNNTLKFVSDPKALIFDDLRNPTNNPEFKEFASSVKDGNAWCENWREFSTEELNAKIAAEGNSVLFSKQASIPSTTSPATVNIKSRDGPAVNYGYC